MTEASKKQDRLSAVLDAPFDPTTLVGSYFLSDAERGWQGCVVAEPSPGVYLVETFDWIVGGSHSQALVRLEEMADWTFFDDAEWMGNATPATERRWDRGRTAS